MSNKFSSLNEFLESLLDGREIQLKYGAKGENLESAFEPIPARLSVVVFNEMANGLPPSPAGKRYRIAATSLNVYRGGPNHRQRRERRVRQPGL